MKQKVSLLAVCAVLLSLFGAGCLAVVLDPGRKAEEQLAAARKEDVFALSPPTPGLCWSNSPRSCALWSGRPVCPSTS